MEIKGIDVSSWQGSLDWETIKSELKRINNDKYDGFVIIRAGHSLQSGKGGLVKDKAAAYNLAECNRLGIPCGVYVYSYDHSADAAKITMQQTLDFIKDYKIEYPVIYDVEFEKFNKNCGKAKNTELFKAALETVEAAGYYAMAYASRSFFLNYTNLSELSAYDKWEAAYVSKDTNDVPNGIWQHDSTNSFCIKGITNLDCDISYKDYKSIITKAKLNNLK
jgi:GH25 family lysozyme M1 (1,4-beta-N-acetylmuramidase)